MSDRLSEIKRSWMTEPPADPEDDFQILADVRWLVAEVERLRESDGRRASWLRWIGKTYPGRRFANDLYLLTQGALGMPLPSPYREDGSLPWTEAVTEAKAEFDAGLERMAATRGEQP